MNDMGHEPPFSEWRSEADDLRRRANRSREKWPESWDFSPREVALCAARLVDLLDQRLIVVTEVSI